jgi:hypothetical protein
MAFLGNQVAVCLGHRYESSMTGGGCIVHAADQRTQRLRRLAGGTDDAIVNPTLPRDERGYGITWRAMRPPPSRCMPSRCSSAGAPPVSEPLTATRPCGRFWPKAVGRQRPLTTRCRHSIYAKADVTTAHSARDLHRRRRITPAAPRRRRGLRLTASASRAAAPRCHRSASPRREPVPGRC